MPPEGTFEHIEFGAQKIHLGAQVILHRDTGDDGEMAQFLARGGVLEQEGLHTFGQDRRRDRQAHGIAAGLARNLGQGEAGQLLIQMQMRRLMKRQCWKLFRM